MPLSFSTFRDRFDEFSQITDATIEAAIAEAELEVAGTEDWGDRRDAAIGLQAAHKLWSSPHGATMRLESPEEASPYLDDYNKLVRKTFPAILVI